MLGYTLHARDRSVIAETRPRLGLTVDGDDVLINDVTGAEVRLALPVDSTEREESGMMDRPQRYSSAQIWLHWCVVAGLILQVVSHEPIVRVMEATRTARGTVSSDMTLAYFHVTVGTSILLAVLARIWLRVRHGTPAPVPGTSRLAALAADFVHRTFYVLLLAMVVTGILTWRGVADLGLIHFAINAAIVVLALGHAGIAIAHLVVLKDGVLARMVPLHSWRERVE